MRHGERCGIVKIRALVARRPSHRRALVTTMSEDFSEKLRSVLRRHLRFLEPGAPLADDAALGALGLDSMAAVNLLVDLEEAFGVQIPDDLLSAETFETVRSLESTFRPVLDVASSRDRPS